MARSRARKAKERQKAQRRKAHRRQKAQWKAQGDAWQKEDSHKAIGTTQRRNFMARRKVYSRHRTLEEQYQDKGQKQDALDYAVSGGHFESNRRKH